MFFLNGWLVDRFSLDKLDKVHARCAGGGGGGCHVWS